MLNTTYREPSPALFEKQTSRIQIEPEARKGTTTITALLLRMGIAAPFLYFGVQLAAAPFFPGYSFLARDASTLGSPGSRLPAVFNIGAICVGIASLLAAWGFLRALRFLGVRRSLAWLAALALVSSALGDINAGLFPLPDPRHTQSLLALCGIGVFLLPFVLPLALWKLVRGGRVAAYFVANIVALFALFPIMSGLVQRIAVHAGVDMPWYQTFLNNDQGLLQRIFALIVFVPVAVTAWFLLRLLRRNESSNLPLPRV
jgi:hypothetical membrane protein